MDKINLVFFGLTKKDSLTKEIATTYEKNEAYTVNFYDDQRGINKYFQSSSNGIFLFTIRNKEDLQSAVAVLRSQRRLIKSGCLKPTCIMPKSNLKIEKILAKYGCKEILPGTIKAKSASFKIDFWSRQINAVLKATKQPDKGTKVSDNEVNKTEGRGTSKRRSSIQNEPALIIQSDTWIIKSKTDTKKVLSRWLVRVIGPSPQVCRWVEVEGDGRKQKCWHLSFENENQMFVTEDGDWFFYGAKPEFDWKTKKWNFSSDAPHLFFRKQNDEIVSRFEFKDKRLHVTENSQYALAKEPLIEKTYDSSYSLDSDTGNEEEKKNIGGDKPESGHLEGELNNKSSESSHMRGNNLVDEGQGIQEGKLKSSNGDMGGHLKGDVKNKDINQEETSDKNIDETSKKDNGKKDSGGNKPDLGGHLEGNVQNNKNDKTGSERDKQKNPTSPGNESKDHPENQSKNESDIPSKETHDDKAVKSLDRNPYWSKPDTNSKDISKKKKPEYTRNEDPTEDTNEDESDLSDKLTDSGKEKSVNENRDENSDSVPNDSSAKEQGSEVENGKSKKKNGKTPPIIERDNLDGKGKTDQIDRSPYGSSSEKSKKEKNKEEKGNRSQQDLGRRSDQKKSLERDNDKKKKEEKEREGFVESPLEDLGGEGKIDKLDRSPYGSKTQQKQAKEDSNRRSNFQESKMSGLAGKGSTDEIDRSHYDSRKSIDHRKEKEERDALRKEFGSRQGREKSNPEFGRDDEVSNREDAMNEALAPDINYGGYELEVQREKSKDLENIENLFEDRDEINIESGEIKVVLRESTSAGNSLIFMCQFDDFYPEELILRAPKASLFTSSRIEAKVTLKYNESKIDIIVKGSILEVESFDDKLDLVVIEISNSGDFNYDEFMNLYNNRQSNIDSFMLKAKGFE